MAQFADIIIGQSLGQRLEFLTYKIPDALQQTPLEGHMVLIPLQNRKVRGLVFHTHNEEPPYKGLKEIVELVYKEPLLQKWQLKTAQWIKQYYYSKMSKVLKLWIPTDLWSGKARFPKRTMVYATEQEMKVQRNSLQLGSVDQSEVPEKNTKQQDIIDCVRVRDSVDEDTLCYETGATKQNIQGLIKKGFLKNTITEVSLLEIQLPEHHILAKQAAFLRDLDHGPKTLKTLQYKWGIQKQKWYTDLKKNKWITLKEEDIKPIATDLSETESHLKKLHNKQQQIFESISTAKTVQPHLVHGITGSGKTELYLHIALEEIKKGNQVAMLVPEIALTPQMEAYFSRVFGDELAIIHSRLSKTEKIAEWYSLWKGYKKIVIGSRSAVFSPLKNLGAIIVDEEHEWTYKQDQDPRYHLRDVAIKMQQETGCKLIFGSATPDVESYFKAKKGEFFLHEMTTRAGTRNTEHGTRESAMTLLPCSVLPVACSSAQDTPQLPAVHIIDLRDEFHQKNKSIFSYKLQKSIKECLEKKQQIMLFLNKRGAHSAVVCRDCGHVCKCPLCEVTMSHHYDRIQKSGKLVCHHCGSIQLPPTTCPHCQSAYIRYIGLGTQKVEEEAQVMFPNARIFRADRDTTGKKNDFKNMYNDLVEGNIDILIGTQMIAKGLDIPNVTLVGIILADTTLHIPDYRSSERLFQLLTQVAGRAGRGSDPGNVIIQTYNPEHPALTATKKHDFVQFYNQEIEDRKELQFPPYKKVIKLTHSHPSKADCMKEIHVVRDQLIAEHKKIQSTEPDFHCDIFTAPAMIPRLHNKYHFHIILKGSEPKRLLDAKKGIIQKYGLKIDVDPVQVC